MSDKSFGDHLNRNIVKNPLLSSAVTGLSIEDLTHNAVLLPAAPSQEINPRQDQPCGPQISTLAQPISKHVNIPPGDANYNLLQSNYPPIDTTSHHESQQNNKNIISHHQITQSKASAKSNDDFDVNEYFARLQGTRYVSAPFNSLLKEDQKATLGAAEENLEEISLDEPEKPPQEVQQSLTADIAQNFSQLPAVLPQVASVVFSSFSNMLSMKSREQTPDEPPVARQSGYQEVTFQAPPDVGAPLTTNVEHAAPKPIAPPPAQPPPIGGTTGYRITTKKKAYAQLPGLSSSHPVASIEPSTAPYYNPNVSFSQFPPQPPSTGGMQINETNTIPNQPTGTLYPVPAATNPQFYSDSDSKECNMFNSVANYNSPSVPQDMTNAQETESNLFKTVEIQEQTVSQNVAAPIIPPPPMFSNIPKDKSESSIKSVLPPSLARRIASNHPIIKPQTAITPVNTDNIFNPAPIQDVVKDSNVTKPGILYPLDATSPVKDDNPPLGTQSAFVLFNTPLVPSETSPVTGTVTANLPSKVAVPLSKSAVNMPPASLIPATLQPDIKSPSMDSPFTVPAPSTNLFASPISQTDTGPPPVFYNPSSMISPVPPLNSSEAMTPQFMPVDQLQHSTLPLMPPSSTLFNPTQQAVELQTNPPSQNADQNTTAEAQKAVPEPPKISGNQSYRMTKKRPQYYSGPIEGVGSLSNNIKPTIPSFEPSAFQGALFTPDQPPTTIEPVNINPSNAIGMNEQTVAALEPSTYTQFDINPPQMQNYAFDMSRQTTDNYELPKQETKGFGIIGSLKSKLSAIDINKIHNSVTTFFDPSYNDTKKEDHSEGSVGYNAFNYQDNSLEVFVPTVEQNSQFSQHYGQYDYQNPHNYGQSTEYSHNQGYSYGAGTQAYDSQSLYSTHSQTLETHNTGNFQDSSYFSHAEAQAAQSATELSESINILNPGIDNTTPTISSTMAHDTSPHGTVQNFIDAGAQVHKVADYPTSVKNASIPPFMENPITKSGIEQIPEIINLINISNSSELVDKSGAVNFYDTGSYPQVFDITQSLHLGGLNDKFEHLNSSDEKREEILPCSSVTSENIIFSKNTLPTESNVYTPIEDLQMTRNDFFDEMTAHPLQSPFDYAGLPAIANIDNNSIDGAIGDILRLDTPTILFGLQSISPKNLSSELDTDTTDVALYENLQKSEAEPSEESFDKVIEESKPLNEKCESMSELNICETCREFNKQEDKEVDDLTSQLIENITSPIQLSNPVIAPLTESSVPGKDSSDFDTTQQCAEITHITEETIETIQVQSATELLDDVDELKNNNTVSYGWTTEEPPFLQTNSLLEHNYSFQIDPNTLGFFGNNAMFYENIPNNASDEIKAEFKSTQDDTPPSSPPSQVSTASAQPATDNGDNKSDESNVLDVHSIEEDANQDYTNFENYLIEPYETDDGKIKFKERERSSEDPVQEVDTFTNRIEKFKQMEEIVDRDTAQGSQNNLLFDINDTNPAVTIASYFDTGNYAAETHYRNSMSSPSVMLYQVGSPSMQAFTIPPGFEEEYKRKLSLMATQDDEKSDKDDNIPYIPDTSTQTRPVVTDTYSSVSNTSPNTTNASSLQFETKPAIEETPATETEPIQESSTICNSLPDAKLASSFFNENADKRPQILQTPDVPEAEIEQQVLPDPISFFSPEEATVVTEAGDNSFNRLASYFTAPPNNAPSKPFFEVSQSQNHLRHANPLSSFDSGVNNPVSCQHENPNQHNSSLQDVPTDIYLANLKLMNDLTSTQNVVFNTNNQIVKTVNYFTVEYDNVELKNSIHEMVKKKLDKEIVESAVEKGECDDANYLTVVTKCKFCCNNHYRRVVDLNRIEIDTDFNVRKAMDGNGKNNNANQTDRKADMDQEQQDSRKEVTVNFGNPLEEDAERVAIMTESRVSSEYSPVKHHWFYRVDIEGKSVWRGFSSTDNRALEDAFLKPDLNDNTSVATDGGRFDVNIIGRLRTPVYWRDKPTNVRRCSWFYKGTTDARYVPYTESIAEKLEEEYRHGMATGEWHRRLVLPSRELVVLHGPAVMVHLAQPPDALASQPLFAFGKRVYRNPPMRVARDQPPTIDHLILLVHGAGEYRKQKEKEKFQTTMRPRVVRRGCDESEIEDPEPSSVDHLLLLCHGVGSACDMRFRSVEEVVDDFRATSLQLLQGHYKDSYDRGVVNRVEVLPVSWHATLHSGETGVDKRLSAITLDSIPRLRNFTNDTVLDVLFYTSPVFCQTIVDTVCAELNRIYRMFVARNPTFSGKVSLGGHSLGSVILYDLLCHQHPEKASENSHSKIYVQGAAGTGQGNVRYPPLDFMPAALYALGSPIAMFECIRGVKSLGADFCLPTCKNFFNIFHPYDPIAYRIEPLINSQLGTFKPYLIPHHKGRKRMHLELKDTMARVGADLKQKLIESLKSTWTSMWKTQPPPNDGQLEKVVEEEMEKEELCNENKEELSESNDLATPDALGALNGGRRVDYVLQEAPFEMINEYLFAMSSHVCYWESEDTMLLILREIYDALGVRPDSSVPQQSMTVQRTRATNEISGVTTTDFPSTSRDGT